MKSEETLEEESLKCPRCGSGISISIIGQFFGRKGRGKTSAKKKISSPLNGMKPKKKKRKRA